LRKKINSLFINKFLKFLASINLYPVSKIENTFENINNAQNSNLHYTHKISNDPIEYISITNQISNPEYNSRKYSVTEINKDEKKQDLSDPEKAGKIEHNLISKILKISFDAKENFFAMPNLKAQFESLEKPLLFKLDELDEYMLEIINNPEINKNVIENFLMFFSRSYTMLEVKHKGELDEKFTIIRKTIGSYLGLIISNPENFGLQINSQALIKNFIDFYNEAEKEEFDLLIMDLVNSLTDDFDGLKKVFSFYIFGIFQEMNLKSECNFYQNDKVKNHLNTIIRMLNDHVILRKLYSSSQLFRIPHLDGKMSQMNTLLGYYFNLVSFECPNHSLIKSAFSSIGMVIYFLLYKNKL